MRGGRRRPAAERRAASVSISGLVDSHAVILARLERAEEGVTALDAELYDAILIPALCMAEADRHKGTLDKVREDFLMQSVGEFIAELADYGSGESPSPGDAVSRLPHWRVVCLPAKDKADEL